MITNGTTLQVGDGGSGPGAASAAATGGNTGNGTMGSITVSAGAVLGDYKLTISAAATDAGTFLLEKPDGSIVGAGTVGAAFSKGGLAFTVADGGTDFVVGDSFTITVTSLGDEAFTAIANVVDIDPPEVAVTEIPDVHLTSSVRATKSGKLPDPGSVTVTFQFVVGNAEQEQLEDDVIAGTVRSYRIVLPDATNGISFSAWVQSFKRSTFALDGDPQAVAVLRLTTVPARLA
jgi:hypothetical protein